MAPAPDPELLVFMSVPPVPALSLSMPPAFVRFRTYFQLSWFAQVEWKMNYNKYTNLKEYTKLVWVI